MNPDDYETLPTQSMGIHMVAGACAGVFEHCAMYMVDCVKTRKQILTPGPGGGEGIVTEIAKMMKQEGITRPFRGITAMVIGAGPAHALYFSCYEYLKETLIRSKSLSQNNHLIYACAGVASTALHDFVMNPAEVVKQRMQMANSPYRSILSCTQHVYATEGLKAFYRSYQTTLLMNVPFQTLHFITYEFVQTITNPKRIYNPAAHMFSGAMAGAVAAAVSMPFDVCKTLLNTQTGDVRVTGMRHAFILVYRYWGFAGYFRGLKARIIYQIPATAICWVTYESFKYFLLSQSSGTIDSGDDLLRIMPNQRNITNNINTNTSSSSTTSFQGAGLYFNNKSSAPVLLNMTRS